MTSKLDLDIDVTDRAGLGEPAHIALTVHLPDPAQIRDDATVAFGKPGGGYSRGYYTSSLPGPAKGAQAEWHAARGWIFVSVDHLGVGDSSQHAPDRLDYPTVSAANYAAEQEVLRRLAGGELVRGLPKVTSPLKLGLGQSMGGSLTIVQQGRFHCYDGIGILGYSAIHAHPPVRPGDEPLVSPWMPRDGLKEPPAILNRAAVDEAQVTTGGATGGTAMSWCFHYDDVDPQIVASDMAPFNTTDNVSRRKGHKHPWTSLTTPALVARCVLTPGVVAPEAAAVRSPVLVALGERDVSADPKGEPRAYLSAHSVDLYICPRMGHMHNFASTRELFWRRIETWADWVRASKDHVRTKIPMAGVQE